MRRIRLTCGLLAIVLFGCRAQQLGFDQDQIRQTLLDLYTNQVMDNLVRARNNLPIIQLDYGSITGTITHNVGGNIGDTQEESVSRLGTTPGKELPAAIGFPVTRTFKNTLAYGANASQINQLTITAQPVVNNNAVYDAYLEFLSDERRLAEGGEPPREGAHAIRRFQGRYYWVPHEYASDFFRLYLVTTALRGQPVSAPRYFENTIAGVVKHEAIPGQKATYRLYVRLRKPIPNDSGELTVVLKGVERKFTIQPVKEWEGHTVEHGALTEVTTFLFNEAQPPALSLQDIESLLENREVRIKLSDYRPENTRTEDLLEAVRHQMELFRLDQLAR